MEFSLLYKGFIIGVLVSAPMGPIGLLCIQRTLNKGRWHGFYSGVGATCSDFLYALLTCLGMGFLINFIETHQGILQIFGGLLLMIFGIYIYRSNPAKNIIKPKITPKTYFQDALTAFFLTLSNPFIIFLFIALFARFNIFSTEETFSLSMLLGLGGIVCGALSWWLLITYLVGKLRDSFNLRGLWLMNRIVGIVIISLSVFGIIYAIWELYQ